jgi:predicted transcriptional regulator
MTNAVTIRLDGETAHELAELAERYRSRSAAVQDAIHQAWRQMQADKLDAGYAAAVSENPHYPYESAEEAAVLRARRRARQERDTLT